MKIVKLSKSMRLSSFYRFLFSYLMILDRKDGELMEVKYVTFKSQAEILKVLSTFSEDMLSYKKNNQIVKLCRSRKEVGK
jgi:hypothetical protein